MEQTPGATVPSAEWVFTNKGTPKAPVPQVRLVARECASNALDRDAVFLGTPGLTVARSLLSKAATCTSSKGQLNIILLHVSAAFLFLERALSMELPQEDPRSSNPNRGLGYSETRGTWRVLPEREACGWISPIHVDDFLEWVRKNFCWNKGGLE